MRFTEHELTAALTGAAKTVVAAKHRDVRRGKRTPDDVWGEMDRLQRFHVLDALGGQLLPVLVALPDVEVETGTRPAFTDEQVTEAVASQLGEGTSGLRRKVELRARTALVRIALEHVPPRSDPDGLVVPDHL
jgi:hypothetical protein